MSQEDAPRVLIIDNDPEVGSVLETILRPRHYRIEVARGSGAMLARQAVRCARRFRPHIAIVDLRLYDHGQDERSGLRLLKDLRSARCIVYSSYLSPEVTREVKRAHGDTEWVSKGEAPQRLIRLIAQAVRTSCAGRRRLSVKAIDWNPSQVTHAIFGARSDVPPASVNDVLRQIFAEQTEISLEPLGDVASLLPSVSRGHSVVYKAQPDGLEPVVVKLAPAATIRKEARNYEKYVKNRLVGLHHARLEQTIGFWDLGAAVYSFLGSSQSRLPSFAGAYLGQTSSDALLAPLAHFFEEVWSRHYHEAGDRLERPLFDVYDDVLHLERHLNKASLEPSDSAAGQPSDPIRWALAHREQSYIPGARQAITHGDLHGDNLFVDDTRAWAIDFGRTGPGHILRDFVELEVDIVTRLVALPPNHQALFGELVTALAGWAGPGEPLQASERLRANRHTCRALEVIGGLRRMAHEMTGYTDIREYLWGLLLDALFAAALVPQRPPQHQRALIFCTALCERLDQLGAPKK